MDKKVKAFFAAMGIATALLVSVSASADNSDSEVQVSIDITWDSLEIGRASCRERVFRAV